MLVRSCLPATNLDISACDLSSGDRWWLVRPKPPRDPLVVAEADGLRLGYYFAQAIFEKIGRDGRRRETRKALFPGYLFLWCDPIARTKLARSPHVLEVAKIGDQERFAQELGRLHAVLAMESPINLGPAITPGATVQIVGGAWDGFTGPVEKIGSKGRLWVSLSVVGQSVSVEFELAQVDLVSQSQGAAVPSS